MGSVGMLELSALPRYFRTLRHVRPVQVYARLLHRTVRWPPDLSPAPPLRQRAAGLRATAPRAKSLVGQGEWVLLGNPGSLDEVGWDGPQRSKLWRYNQHYFDDLNAADSKDRFDWHLWLLDDWLKHNKPGSGTGWEPYPTSLRMVNWIKWALMRDALTAECIESLAIQARWLAKRVEIHLLGNHLIANAKALVFAGLFFRGDEATRWLLRGLRILLRELPEQILPDGGHFERSPMYHALVLEDLLDIRNIFDCYPDVLGESVGPQVAGWSRQIEKMRTWLRALCHPDGEFAFFNDAAFGVSPSVVELERYADRMEGLISPVDSDVTWLRDSGYARMSRADAVVILDMAPVGPDYLPAHAHADTLSFELSLFGYRVLVNSGTSCYGTSPERLRQRGTSAHNTVTVDGLNSSEVWGAFRVGRRANPINPQVVTGNVLIMKCAHDGYCHLPGGPVHERHWLLGPEGLETRDFVKGGHGTGEARFHFHPDILLDPSSEVMSGRGLLPNGKTFTWSVDAGEARIEATTWHPRFGVTIPNSCLVVMLDNGRAMTRINWN